MRKLLFFLVVAVAAPVVTLAGEVAITGQAGYTFPFYSQTFAYSPGAVSVPVPGMSLEQSGSFQLKGSGSAAFGGAIAFYPSTAFGLELRLDNAGLNVEASEATFHVKATVPGASAPVDETLTLTNGTAELDSLRPLSINLKLRTTGSTKLFVSGGASYVKSANLRVQQTVALGVTEVNLLTGTLKVGTQDLVADQSLQVETSSWGGNLGLGLEIPLGEHAGLLLEGRGFYFPTQQVEWKAVTTPTAGSIEAQLLARVLQSLPPVDFEPRWVQASGGIIIRF
jgi:hypothetical protein